MKGYKVYLFCLCFLLGHWEQVSARALYKRSPARFDHMPLGFSPSWKQCAWDNINDGRDNGLIKACDFVKWSDSTVLKVTFDGDYRIAHCKRCCKRWFFTFNGAECRGPLPIDAVELYNNDARNRNHHQHHTIQGFCTSISKGKIRVGINVGNCRGLGNADAWTGWNSVTRIIVEEFPAAAN